MFPLLKHIADGNPHTNRDVVEALASVFKLTEDEKNEMLPSGVQQAFYNRVMWARFYLVKAGLMTSPKRGAMQITPRGQEVLKSKPDKLNIAYLRANTEFSGFQSPKRESQAETIEAVELEVTRTPDEILDGAYNQIREAVGQELLTKVYAMSWQDFERLVVDLLVRMGYGGSVKDPGHANARGGDEGIDGIIKEDKLGLDIIYIQAKKWDPSRTVDRPEIHKFIGALAGQGAKKGVFITTSSFSKGARDFTPRNDTKIVLIDGEELTQLMIDHDLGVTTERSYVVKRIDNDFFEKE